MQSIETHKKLKANGHYANVVVENGFAYVSGQFAVNPDTGEREFGSVEHQARRALENIELWLRTVGSDRMHIVKTTAYIADVSMWGGVDRIYAEFFGSHKPARSVVPVKELHFGFLIEIEAIASVGEKVS